eukprot:TRINITY_DN10292_c0_g1_i1.p2 TRINITY_DN10292_c0_g1~~TRINITY_DN10292_c0_g1_i1.p2  ORF type:complete len:143 (-),score=13.72 TRINITY_DN10292_c0_g1_i1:73-453(-)
MQQGFFYRLFSIIFRLPSSSGEPAVVKKERPTERETRPGERPDRQSSGKRRKLASQAFDTRTTKQGSEAFVRARPLERTGLSEAAARMSTAGKRRVAEQQVKHGGDAGESPCRLSCIYSSHKTKRN